MKLNVKNLKNIATLNQESRINNLLLLKKEKCFVSCSNEALIKIFSYENSKYECLITIKEHSKAIYNIQETKKGEIISSSNDETIKIFSFNLSNKTYQCLLTFKGHKEEVFKAIELSNANNIYASCSADNIILIWNRETNQTQTIFKLKFMIWCILEISNNRIVFSSSDPQRPRLIFLNYKNLKYEHEMNLISCSGNNGICNIKNNLIAIISFGAIFIVNTDLYILEQCFNFDEYSYFWCVYPLSNENLVISGYVDNIFQYDYKIGKIIGKSSMFLHDLAILSIIEPENNVLITCSTDSTIKIWKFEY